MSAHSIKAQEVVKRMATPPRNRVPNHVSEEWLQHTKPKEVLINQLKMNARMKSIDIARPDLDAAVKIQEAELIYNYLIQDLK